jgi:hypothetical protein
MPNVTKRTPPDSSGRHGGIQQCSQLDHRIRPPGSEVVRKQSDIATVCCGNCLELHIEHRLIPRPNNIPEQRRQTAKIRRVAYAAAYSLH